jgi:hypothetical protein
MRSLEEITENMESILPTTSRRTDWEENAPLSLLPIKNNSNNKSLIDWAYESVLLFLDTFAAAALLLGKHDEEKKIVVY